MSSKSLDERWNKIRYWSSIFSGEKKYIFIISHMRSRSSLLSHILGSHSEISGYAEISQSYHRPKDFKDLRYAVWNLNNKDLKGRYVLDKLLHNRYSVADSILMSPSVYVCFLLRRPEDAVRSVMRLAKLHAGASIWEDAEAASLYYNDRISQMVLYADKCFHKSFFIESDQLITDTEALLAALSKWLVLEEPLSSRYTVFAKTGKPGFGDPSKVILAGKVVANESRYNNIHLSRDVLEKSRKLYDLATDTFAARCIYL
jgi:hypothetical protein